MSWRLLPKLVRLRRARNSGGLVNRARAWLALAVFALGCGGCGRSCQVEPVQPPYEPPPVATAGAAGAGGQGAGAVTGTGGQPTERPCEWVPARAEARAAALAQARTLRVVGGSLAARLPPGIAAVETASGFQFCACVLTAPDICVTAAHCQQQPGDVVHAGTLDLREPGQQAIVLEARMHPLWGPGHDVAVLRLVSPLEVEIATLRAEPVAVGDTVQIFGWGRTTEGGSTTQMLRRAEAGVVDWGECGGIYSGLTITDLCAGGAGTDACQGDSGGPLYDEQDRAVGIVSRGIGCGRPGIPGVCTAVSEVYEWIEACSVP